MKLLALLLSLSLLVLTHELGHLGFAKLFKTRVNRFYLFFNPMFSLFKAKKFDGKWHFLFFSATTPKEWEEKEPDNTLWGIGWMPLGGYCDIAGMVDETKSANDLASEPQPWEYRSKPAWQRLCIISGGVLVNFISALLIYTCIFAHWGDSVLPTRNATYGYEYSQILLDEGLQQGDIIYAVDGVELFHTEEIQEQLLLHRPSEVTVLRGDSLLTLPLSRDILERVNANPKEGLITGVRMPFQVGEFAPNSAAEKAGLMVGDRVVAVNGEALAVWSDIKAALGNHAGDTVSMTYLRNSDTCQLSLVVPNNGLIGVQLEGNPSKLFCVEHREYTFFQALPAGISHGWNTLTTYVTSLKALFVKGGAQNLGGFITMGSIFPKQWDWYRFWDISALLAIILAFMNIIPIPGLDGGHVIITLYEMVTRRKPSERFLTVAQNIGMALLLLLLIVANGNDILRLFR